MDPKKIDTVSKIEPSSINTLEKVRSFLGLCSYYRRFISNFSKISSSLSDLTRIGVDVAEQSQSEACQNAIRALKDAITSEPVLGTPRYDRPFIVKTDAANTEGIGGVLSQLDDEGRERPIAYYGRRLNPKGERNYTVTEIEMLAAIRCIKHWRTYLWGRRFKLVVDHQALRWLHTMRDTMEGGPASRVMRWILSLQEYDFDVEYKPGSLHKDADGISRLATPVLDAAVAPFYYPDQTPQYAAPAARARVTTARSLQAEQRTESSKHKVTQSYLNTSAPSLDVLREEQRDDPEVRALRQYIDVGRAIDPTSSESLRRATWLAREVCLSEDGRMVRRIIVEDDVVYRRTSSGKRLPYVPVSLRLPILTAFHDQLGHPSAARATRLIRERFYWPNLGRDVIEHVAECHECTLAKPGIRPRRSVGPSIGQYPFDVCFADILDMDDTHDYDSSKGTGYRKLLVFVDSLTRWVEAIPLHKDPTSEQVLDIFMAHIVSRHGAPRRIISDSGSNLASRLCDTIMKSCGVDLRPVAADHHEAAGTVERFQSTLINMARSSDEGGRYWSDHLPFLLMSYRATPHRVTALSPASLLYGRELRLPQEMPSESLPSGVPAPADAAGTHPSQAAITEYALRLHQRLAYAWQAASEATLTQQSQTIRDAELKTKGHRHTPDTYKVGDRVVRYIHDRPNKLQYVYAGPYRVTDDLGNGRYRLRDLENNHVRDEIDASNLRPYRTTVDAHELQDDEFVVDRVLDRKERNSTTHYLVKWRGYPRSQATWEPRRELERRCSELLVNYDSKYPPAQARRAPLAPVNPNVPAPPAALPVPAIPVNDNHLPHVAKFERGQWVYGRNVTSPRGSRLRFYPAANYTASELASTHFTSLRADASAVLMADPVVAAVFNAVSNPCHESVVWFSTLRKDALHLLCCAPSSSDATPSNPFGGFQAASDNGAPNTCAYRCIRENSKIPSSWKEDLHLALASDPDGHFVATSDHPCSLWHVLIQPESAHLHATLTPSGCSRYQCTALKWQPAADVLRSLNDSQSVPLRGLLLATYPNHAESLPSVSTPPAPLPSTPEPPDALETHCPTGLNPDAAPWQPPQAFAPKKPLTRSEYLRAVDTGDEVALSHATSQGVLDDDPHGVDKLSPIPEEASN